MATPETDPWFAPSVEPPYVGALFSTRVGADTEAREVFSAEFYRRAAMAPGFIGAERSADPNGHIIAAIFFRDRSSLDAWIAAIEGLLPTADPRAERTRLFDYCVMRIVTVEDTFTGLCPMLPGLCG